MKIASASAAPRLVARNDNECRLADALEELGRRAHIKRRRNESLLQYALRLQGATYWLAHDAHRLLTDAETLYDTRSCGRPQYSTRLDPTGPGS